MATRDWQFVEGELFASAVNCRSLAAPGMRMLLGVGGMGERGSSLRDLIFSRSFPSAERTGLSWSRLRGGAAALKSGFQL